MAIAQRNSISEGSTQQNDWPSELLLTDLAAADESSAAAGGGSANPRALAQLPQSEGEAPDGEGELHVCPRMVRCGEREGTERGPTYQESETKLGHGQ